MGIPYHRHLEAITTNDAIRVAKRDEGYAGSWMKNGGRGAFENLRRKWDRIAQAVAPVAGARERARELIARLHSPEDEVSVEEISGCLRDLMKPEDDVFYALQMDQRPEGLIADIRDLRRYFILVEAHAIQEGWILEEPEED